MRNKKKSKQQSQFFNWMIVILGGLWAIVAIGAGQVHYQPVIASQQEQIRLEKQQREDEIKLAFKAQDKLNYTEAQLNEYITKNEAIIAQNSARTILDLRNTNRPRYIVEVMFRLWEKEGGTYDYVPYCIAAYESNFYTFTHNQDGEDSRGLFQVNVPYHENADPVKLFEPVYNMEYMFPELTSWEKKGIAQGLTGEELVLYVVRKGQRPAWENPKVQAYIRATVKSAYAEFNRIKLN